MKTNMQTQKWDTSYEWKAVLLLSLGFGLVGLDRWIIAPLLPSIMKDLSLNYQRCWTDLWCSRYHLGHICNYLGQSFR